MIAEIKSYHCQEKLTTGHVHHAAVLPEILLALSNTPRPVPLHGTLFLSNYHIVDFSSSVQFPNDRISCICKAWFASVGRGITASKPAFATKDTSVDSCRADMCPCSAIPFLPIERFPMTSVVTLL